MLTKHCSTCTCGLILVEWSDRSRWIDPTSIDELVFCIHDCVFDHSYDRTSTGIPYNFPSDLGKILVPIVAEQMDKINRNWKNETIYPTHEESRIFDTAIRNVIRKFCPLMD